MLVAREIRAAESSGEAHARLGRTSPVRLDHDDLMPCETLQDQVVFAADAAAAGGHHCRCLVILHQRQHLDLVCVEAVHVHVVRPGHSQVGKCHLEQRGVVAI